MDVKGLGAVVTGAGSGLGAETARHLAKSGAKVAVLDVNEEAAKAVAAEIGGIGLACDVASAAAGEEAVAKARDTHGPCRILVNCAGIAPAKRIVGRDGAMPLDAFEKVIAVNLIGSFNMLRLCAADMLGAEPLNDDGERGVIISTSSIAGVEGQLGQVAYAASKAGINGMMLPAAREFARSGVRVLTIAPGLIGTPLLLNMPQEVQDNLAGQVPFPSRFGHPSEFARLVLHICENAMLNADIIRLDGAMRMQ
ncbi:SDR family NAD(P)-dependent oxidoreductase [Limibacillus halophilus]|uniref:NAD(P)-dependent dehydrogenase (Short-subunit alcohol dehydrogenase family) n=1 Tax=Limibacillus halophilus TaxID=1579333 RepID=A0A839SR53_9PROT|nr:SDR family NAD(P)-dependent oxidoreductase [Limibacillus halophilus]MBB3065281.1 NAD(P)-dependent dehydrogenase (short-subunit alcohol dehydrogenase family) [Limibacillus halophilus]